MKRLAGSGIPISKRIGKAIADFDLLNDGDKIIVAISGGKDSLTLLKMLIERQRWAPVKYDLLAAHIITDFKCAGCAHQSKLQNIFEEWGVDYRFINVTLGAEKGTSCFWCAWNRRKALFELARETGYNKIALGHHKDDIVETFLLNLFYNGEISSINANQPLFDGKIRIIRPLAYVEEEAIKKYSKEAKFIPQVCKCPNARDSKRAVIKRLLSDLEKSGGYVKSNIFNAPSRIKHDYLGQKIGCKTNNI